MTTTGRCYFRYCFRCPPVEDGREMSYPTWRDATECDGAAKRECRHLCDHQTPDELQLNGRSDQKKVWQLRVYCVLGSHASGISPGDSGTKPFQRKTDRISKFLPNFNLLLLENTNLDAGLAQSKTLGEFLAHVGVRVVGFFEEPFQFGQLFQSEISPTPPRFDLARLKMMGVGRFRRFSPALVLLFRHLRMTRRITLEDQRRRMGRPNRIVVFFLIVSRAVGRISGWTSVQILDARLDGQVRAFLDQQHGHFSILWLPLEQCWILPACRLE